MALELLDILNRGPVVPVIVLHRLEDAKPLADALLAGGCSVAEITLRTGCALAAIAQMAKAFPEMAVGAGTLKGRHDVYRVQEAGAAFGVSPGYTREIHDGGIEANLPLLPGVATPSEVLTARSAGHRFLKFFPAEQSGGAAFLKSIGSPIPQVKFCPTGGISLKNAPDYLSLKNILCVGGSWVAPKEAMAQGDWAVITKLAAEARALR